MATKKVALTPVYQKLDAAYRSGRYNVFVLEGGSRSSKTYSIIQFWIVYAKEHQDRTRRVIISRLKATWITATVLKDFIDVLKDYGIYDKHNHNKSVGAGVYTLYTTEFWFLGLDDEQRIHGMKSDAFWINEAVEAGFDDYAQLMQRCSGFAVLDYNPSYDEHWIYDKICRREKTRYMHSTMLDNPLIPDNAKEQILSYEPTPYNVEHGTADKRKWMIYGLGKRASLEGLIFENWSYCKEIPQGLKKHGYGMDFGFTLDQTAIVECAFDAQTNTLYLDELCYRTHMESADIIRFCKQLTPLRIISESADPRLVSEIQNAGIRIYPVVKGPGSVEASISVMKGYKILITERSVNLIKEIKNYTWEFDDKTKRFVNKPAAGQADHCFTGDTLITTPYGKTRIDRIAVGDKVITSSGMRNVCKVFDNGIRSICHVRLIFNDFKVDLKVTPDHKVKTVKGWKQVNELKRGDVLYTFKCSTAKNTSYIPERNIFQEDVKDYIVKYGNSTTGTFLKAIMYTIRMETCGIMKLTTLNLLKVQNTFAIMRKNIRRILYFFKKLLKEWIMHGFSLTNGMVQRKGGNGTVKWLKNKPRMSNQRNSYVHGAEKSLNQSQTVLTDSAQINANPHIDCIQELTMKQEFVKNADANLLLTSTIKTNIAADSVLQNIEEATLIGIEIIEESSQRVYDLEIEDEHEYFANGVLVHNCLDAARYWTIGELMGRIKQTRDYSGIFGH